MVTIRDLSFGYTKRRRLFRNLDMELTPGGIHGLLGKNGAGKTTLLKLLCGLRFPQGGSCRVLGLEPASRPVELLQDVFLLPEELSVPPVPGSMYVELYAPFYPHFDRESFAAHLREFEVDGSGRLTELSYGQKKKFLLAFGLASGARLMLLDEPTNGLDIPSKSQFRRLLARATSEDRVIVISTHQVRDMENLIDPVVILDDGRIIFSQPVAEVSRRLVVRQEREEPRDAEALYAEKTLAGYTVVRPNPGSEESAVDLETLFNTLTSGSPRVAELFGGVSATGREN
jgi:ABC-2 type transport system ATP-binding protein